MLTWASAGAALTGLTRPSATACSRCWCQLGSLVLLPAPAGAGMSTTESSVLCLVTGTLGAAGAGQASVSTQPLLTPSLGFITAGQPPVGQPAPVVTGF